MDALEGAAPGEVVYVPLTGQDACLGVLRVGRGKGSQPFDAREIGIIETFAHQAALAVELARSRDDRDQVGKLEDRERIAAQPSRHGHPAALRSRDDAAGDRAQRRA